MKRLLHSTLFPLMSVSLLVSCNGHQPDILIDGIRATATAEQIVSDCDVALNNASAQLKALEEQKGQATLTSVYGQYEKIVDALVPIGDVWHIRSVHPDSDVRSAANECSEKQSDFYSQISLSRPVYDRISAISQDDLSASELFMVQNAIDDFKRSGVDRGDATRKRIRELQKEITAI